jgi:hypothetical protein
MAQQRSKVPPATAQDKALSQRHLKQSIRYNESHAREHTSLAKADRKKLAATRRKRLPKV